MPLFRDRDPPVLDGVLAEFGHAVSRAGWFGEVLRLTVDSSTLILNGSAALVLLREGRSRLRIREHRGLSHVPERVFPSSGDDALVRALRERVDELPEQVLVAPLVVQGRFVGALAVGWRADVEMFGDEASILRMIADQVAAPLDSVRLAEEARSAESLAHDAALTAGIGTFHWDFCSASGSFSPESYRLNGVPPGTPVHCAVAQAPVHPDDHLATLALIARLRRAARGKRDQSVDGVVEAEYRVVLPDDTTRWISARVRVVPGTRERPGRVMGVMLDVTDRKQAEVALRASEERLRLATETVAGFLYDWDPASGVVERFGGTEDVVGHRLDEVSADLAWWEERVHPVDLPRAWAQARTALESTASGYVTSYRIRHRLGHYVRVIDRGRIVRNPAGEAIRVLGAVGDVSARWRRERGRKSLLKREKAARVAAEGAALERDRVLSMVAHDLQAPLMSLSICANALRQKADTSREDVREIIALLQRSTRWMEVLIHDLEDDTRIGSGQLSLNPSVLPPAALLREVVEMFDMMAHERGVALTTQSEDVPELLADAMRVKQVLANLVANALRFTPPGGRVTLCAARAPAAVRFSVEDTGAGIAPEDLPHVFDRYWRKGDAGMAGNGLGLAIVRGIVEAHGGEVDVRSAPGRGSRFSFTIPLKT